MKPEVSVIVATYNEEAFIGKLLDSLLGQDCKKPFEILVMDGKSTDKTIEIVQTYAKKHKQIKLFENPKRKPAYAFNIGIQESKGKYVAIMGAHAQATRNWLSTSLQTIQEAPPNVMAVGGRLLSATTNNTFLQAVNYVTSTFWGGGVSTHRFSRKQQYVDTVVFGLYKKEVFDKVGVMDTKMVVGQDGELNYRIRKKGYTLLFNPQIQTIYYSRSNPKKLRTQIYNYGVGRTKIIRKHGLHKISNILPLLFGGYVYVLPLLLLASILSKGPLQKLFLFTVAPAALWLLITTIMSAKHLNTFAKNFLAYTIIHVEFGKGMLKEFLFPKRKNYK